MNNKILATRQLSDGGSIIGQATIMRRNGFYLCWSFLSEAKSKGYDVSDNMLSR